MNLLAMLRGARRLLAENGWCQHTLATDGRYSVDVHSPKARCYCAVGALWAMIPPDIDSANWHARKAVCNAASFIRDKVLFMSLVDWNDESTRSKYDVIEVFDKAISIAANDPSVIQHR